MNMADLEGSQDLENHAILVMNAIDESLSHFHQEAQLIEMLIGTGKFHIDLEDFKPHLFYVRHKVNTGQWWWVASGEQAHSQMKCQILLTIDFFRNMFPVG